MKNTHPILKPVFFFILTVLFCRVVYSQQVTNVEARLDGKKIIVTYNLIAKQGVNEYEVKFFVSTNGGINWEQLTKGITGDAGKSITAGSNKAITWDVLATRDKLQGDNIRFKITATFNDKGNYTETATGSASGIEMVYVQGGTFTMGCTSEQGSDCDGDEKPAHSVTVSNFYIGKYEVTQKQWRAVMGASATLSSPSYFKNCDECPVEQVSWNDIQEFLMKLNAKTGKTYRLPTEAEWEYAARGGSKSRGYKYSGSNDLGSVAWYTENSNSKTHPVGQKSPNELGIYDMSGNVWEWCSDWYGSYSSNNQNNPIGANTGSGRVNRGGGWNYDARRCRASNRNNYTPDARNGSMGFRLAGGH